MLCFRHKRVVWFECKAKFCGRRHIAMLGADVLSQMPLLASTSAADGDILSARASKIQWLIMILFADRVPKKRSNM